jgi:hypothetical protein
MRVRAALLVSPQHEENVHVRDPHRRPAAADQQMAGGDPARPRQGGAAAAPRDRQLAATNIYNNIPVTLSKDVATITNLQTEIGAKDGTINKLQDEIRNRDATISELKDQNQLMMYWRREFFTMSGKLGKVEKELSDKRSDEALRQALPQMGSIANVRSKDVRTEHNISDCNNPNDKAFRNFESQGIVTAYNYHHC